MEGVAVSGMSAFLTAVGSIVTAAIGWMGDYVGAITSQGNEMLMLFIALPLVGTGIGLLKRMISIN